MTTKKYILTVCGLLCLLSVAYGQKRETYFFSAEDMANIRSSAQTPWGKTIVDTLKSHIDERLKYPLAVPEEEAGHLHDYFCPVHNVFFEFDWNSPDKQFLTDCMYVYLAIGDKKYARYMKDMLLDFADKYPHYKIHDKGRNTPEPANYIIVRISDIVTKTGTERRPVETCYPLMIRVKDKNMTVRAQWDIF